MYLHSTLRKHKMPGLPRNMTLGIASRRAGRGLVKDIMCAIPGMYEATLALFARRPKRTHVLMYRGLDLLFLKR